MASVTGVPDPHEALANTFRSYASIDNQAGVGYSRLKLDDYDESGKVGVLDSQIQNLRDAISDARREFPGSKSSIDKIVRKIKKEHPLLYQKLIGPRDEYKQ